MSMLRLVGFQWVAEFAMFPLFLLYEAIQPVFGIELLLPILCGFEGR